MDYIIMLNLCYLHKFVIVYFTGGKMEKYSVNITLDTDKELIEFLDE